jgi:uncharacterized protein (DUF934 family)
MSAMIRLSAAGARLAPKDKRALTPLADWLAAPAEQRGDAIVLTATDDPDLLIGNTAGLAAIAVEFPKFNDGRGLSIARLLRGRIGWRGELRAVGEVARDQLFYMARCGFDAFDLRADQDAEACLRAFSEVSVLYQNAADEARPLFRRRAEALAALEKTP